MLKGEITHIIFKINEKYNRKIIKKNRVQSPIK
jgi:hypothetical protein